MWQASWSEIFWANVFKLSFYFQVYTFSWYFLKIIDGKIYMQGQIYMPTGLKIFVLFQFFT